jgi:hypothetical protein
MTAGKNMEGNGYIGGKTMGVNIHSCLAVTPEGLVLGVPGQTGFNRAERKKHRADSGAEEEPADRGKGKQPAA